MDNLKKLPIGYENFKKLIEDNAYYVDKTKVIEEIRNKGGMVSLFPRPRRFGKTLFMSMLNEFFNIEYIKDNKNLFKDLYIEKSPYYKELSSSPVIFLSFKGITGNSYEDVYMMIKELIRSLYSSKRYLKDKLESDEIKIFDDFLNETAEDSKYMQSLKIMSEYLYKYYNRKVIILIDEYDVPIQDGYLKGYYDEVINLIKGMFSSVLKTNDYLEFGIMTGILRVSKESIFSDLNNVDVYGITDSYYNDYFGFTESETRELLSYYNLKLNKEVKDMYDGYNFNKVSIYNPWSIINYANRKILVPYWVNTSSNNLIKETISKCSDNVKVIIERLISGSDVNFRYNDKITYLDLRNYNSIDTVLNFFLMSGYLTTTNDFSLLNDINKIKIPNGEVKRLFTDIIKEYITGENISIYNELIYDFNKAILNKDKIVIENTLNKALSSMSYYDNKESFYHGYSLGLFLNFLTDKEYILKSNREAGMGRYDIAITKKDRSIGIIIEFKIADTNENIEKYAKKAIKQMRDKEYYKELVLDKVEDISCYAIVFKDKRCIVR